MKTSLPEWALKRPVTVMMLLITVIGFGIVTLMRIPVAFMPPIELPFLYVWIPYSGATPEQAEQEIAIPAEGEFQTLPNLKSYTTTSNGDYSDVFLEFEMGTDMNTALAEVRDRMERLRLVMPEEVDKIFIYHFNTNSMPIMQFGLSSDGDYEAFGESVDKSLVPRLLRLEGVGNVDVWGWEERDIYVELDQQALTARNVDLYELIMNLNVGNVDMGVGQLNDGDQEFLVRVESKLNSLDDYRRLPLGNGVRLGEVASGSLRAWEEDHHYSIDGQPLLYLQVSQESGANTAATCKAVSEELERIFDRPDMDDAEMVMYFNQGDIITGALIGLTRAALYGGMMSLLVLFLFLRKLLPTIIVALAIPGSLLMAFVFLYASDMTLNLITMVSLMIAVGMVVDNSIVVVENIYRYQRLGLGAYESARKGASEVSLAIVAATLTTAVVFVPVMYIEGQMAVLMKHFAIPVVVALVSSLLLALTVIPLALSRLKPIYQAKPDEDYKPKRLGGLSRLNPIRLARSFYHRLLHYTVRHRMLSLCVMFGFIALTVSVPMAQMGFQQMPTSDGRKVVIRVNFDNNYTMEMAGEVFDAIGTALEPRREELGIKNIFNDYGVRGGSMTIFLQNKDDLGSVIEAFPYTSNEVMDILWYILPEQAPGVEFTVSTDNAQQGGRSSQRSISVRLEGDDIQTLNVYAQEFRTKLEGVQGITSTQMSAQKAEQEIQLKIDNELAASFGLDPMQIAQTVTFAIRGTQVSKIKSGSKEITVWAQFEENDRKTIANLNNIMLTGSTGAKASLGHLVTQTKARTPQSIKRRNGKNFVMLTGNIGENDMLEMSSALHELIDDFNMRAGYTVRLGNEMEDMDADIANFFILLFMGMLLIYIVMSALFESCLLPLSILTTVPLAFLGVVWMMFLTDTPLDMVAFIGCILMVGVVVNNGIVIVDHINQLRNQGLPRHEAIVQAGRDRLRPVLMTAFTTILGAIPLAIGDLIGQPAVVSLGMSMIGGLTAGTFLTLLVVPLFYSLVDDVQDWCRRFLGELVSLKS